MQQTESGSSDPRVVAGFRTFSRGVGLLAMAVALVVLAGWGWGFTAVTDLMTGVNMKVNTALGMFLVGLALVLCHSAPPRIRWLSGVVSLAALLLGGVTLMEYITGIDAGIDTLWREDPSADWAGRSPGRMSQLTAMALVLLGSAGVAMCARAGVTAAQVLALGVIAIALYAFSAFGYHGMDSQASFSYFHPVALHSAVLSLLLSLGWLAARPDVGIMRVLAARSFGGALARRALLPSVLVPTLLSYFAQVLQQRGVLSPDATITLLAVASGGLVAWIIWTVSVLLDRVEREQRITSHLREDANTDPLTQLANRRAFQTAVRGLLRRRREEDAVFSLLVLDLDKFKQFNDAHGHVAGDNALRMVGQLLKAALRPGDVAARYGGEEFAVLLPGIDGERAVLVAERIRRDFHIADWPDEPLTVSIGVAQGQPDDEEQALVARADRALYAAKATGRDRVVADAALPSLPEPAPLQPNLI